MAKSAKIVHGSLDLTSASGQNFTSSGFGTPDGALIYYSNASSNDTDTDGLSFGVCCWDGTNIMSVCNIAEDNQSKSDTAIEGSTSKLIYATPDNVTVLTAAVVNTTDGITITLDSTGSGSILVDVILFGGGLNIATNVENALGAATETLSPGFVADVLMMWNFGVSVPDDNMQFTQGIAVNGGSQFCFGHGSQNNQNTSSTQNSAHDSAIITERTNPINDYYSVTSWTAGAGTDIELTETGAYYAGTYDAIWFAIGGVNNAHLGKITIPSSPGTTSVTTSFQPDFLLTHVTNISAWDTYSTTLDVQAAIGCYDGTTQHSIGMFEEDAVATMNNGSRHASAEINESYQSETGTDGWRAVFDSWNSTSYTLDFTQVDTNAASCVGLGLAIQWEAAGAATYTGHSIVGLPV